MFLDLKKAFDTVNQSILVSKLHSYNFSSGTLKWIESYLLNKSQFVQIENYQSTALHLSTGIPQGSVLGPLLFSLYINDLPSVCPDTNIQMYADDTVIYLHGSKMEDVEKELTKSMVHETTWLTQCCLQLNVFKTVCMFFTKRNW